MMSNQSKKNKKKTEKLKNISPIKERKSEEDIIESIRTNFTCKTQNQKKLLESIKKNQITIASGRAGSGKTFITCAESINLIKKQLYKKILLVKSVVTLESEEIGFLKGNLEEKISPYYNSFVDNFDKLIGESNFNKLKEFGVIKFLPIAFIRGRTLDHSIIIIDEAQNITMNNMKTLMTRIGENSKMILLGDVKQKDLSNKKNSSLEIISKEFMNTPDFGVVELYGDEDVVRNPIIKIIEDTFEKIENKSK